MILLMILRCDTAVCTPTPPHTQLVVRARLDVLLEAPLLLSSLPSRDLRSAPTSSAHVGRSPASSAHLGRARTVFALGFHSRVGTHDGASEAMQRRACLGDGRRRPYEPPHGAVGAVKALDKAPLVYPDSWLPFLPKRHAASRAACSPSTLRGAMMTLMADGSCAPGGC